MADLKADLQAAMDGLVANTKAIDDAEDSAEAAFLRLADMIAALKTSATIDPQTITQIQALSDELKARAGKLAAAVVATPTS